MKSLLPSLFSLLPGRRPGPSRRSAPVSPGAKPRGGFTLLELVAVIGIIAVMSVIVVSGYSGITRSLSAQAGTDALKRMLLLARQQACIDGVDTYLWVTGVDSFVVVRRAGTVSKEPTRGTRKPGYLKAGGEYEVTSNWIVDEFADLSGASQSFLFDDKTTPEQKKDAIKQYSSGDAQKLVFDMDAVKTAVVEYPPFFDPDVDGWVFGIASIPSGAFKKGNAYGWLALPEQRLPKGFSFDVPYKIDSEGNVTVEPNRAPHVHFLPDGSVEKDETFTLKDASGNASRPEVSVDSDGKISAKTK